MRRHINEFMKTEFINRGRAAGMGILYDRYDEESSPEICPMSSHTTQVRFPHDEEEEIPGQVTTYKMEVQNE
jgi:hypothetical protein